MFWKQEVLDYIDEKLSQTWSPEQIAKTPCGMKMPSFKEISAFYPKESAQERENAEKDGKRRKIHDGKEYPKKG